MRKLCIIGLAGIFCLSSCQNENVQDETLEISEEQLELEQFNKENHAALQGFIEAFQNQEVQHEVIETLSQAEQPVLLSSIINKGNNLAAKSSKVWSSVASHVTILEEQNSRTPLKAKVPEIWMFNKKEYTNVQELLFMYASENKADDSKDYVTAYDINGTPVKLNSQSEPEMSVIIIDNSGSNAMSAQLTAANIELQRLGLQDTKEIIEARTSKGKLTGRTTLKSMKMRNDHEPWFRGAAEIYALITGLRDDYSKTEKVLYYEFPSINNAKKIYNVNATAINWASLGYKNANVQFLEHDYGSIVEYIKKIGEIALDEKPAAKNKSNYDWVKVLGLILLDVIGGLFNQADDNVDDYYLIEHGKSYKNYVGARQNTTITLEYTK